METLLFFENRLSVRWEDGLVHMSFTEYGKIAKHVPYVPEDTPTKSIKDKIDDQKAFRFKIDCSDLTIFETTKIINMFEPFKQIDKSLDVHVRDPRYIKVLVEDPNRADDFKKVRAKHQSIMEEFESIKIGLLFNLQAKGFSSNSIELHLKSTPEYPADWFISKNQLASVSNIWITFRRESPVFKLFDESGWIERYHPF